MIITPFGINSGKKAKGSGEDFFKMLLRLLVIFSLGNGDILFHELLVNVVCRFSNKKSVSFKLFSLRQPVKNVISIFTWLFIFEQSLYQNRTH